MKSNKFYHFHSNNHPTKLMCLSPTKAFLRALNLKRLLHKSGQCQAFFGFQDFQQLLKYLFKLGLVKLTPLLKKALMLLLDFIKKPGSGLLKKLFNFIRLNLNFIALLTLKHLNKHFAQFNFLRFFAKKNLINFIFLITIKKPRRRCTTLV